MSYISEFMDFNWQLLHRKDFEKHEKLARLTTNYIFYKEKLEMPTKNILHLNVVWIKLLLKN